MTEAGQQGWQHHMSLCSTLTAHAIIAIVAIGAILAIQAIPPDTVPSLAPEDESRLSLFQG